MADMKVKKKPERRCVGCGEHKPKSELIRLVRDPSGEVSLDFTSKKSGRGVYICNNISCMRAARKAKRFESNLSVVISDEIYRKLEEEITN